MPWRCYFGCWKTTPLSFPTHLTLSDYVFSLLTRFFPNQITLCLPLCFRSPLYLSLWALSTFSSFGDGWVSIYTSFLPLHCTSFKAEINPTYFCPFLKMLYSLKEKWVPAPRIHSSHSNQGIFFKNITEIMLLPYPNPPVIFLCIGVKSTPLSRVHKSRVIWPPSASPTALTTLSLFLPEGPWLAVLCLDSDSFSSPWGSLLPVVQTTPFMPPLQRDLCDSV